MCAGEVSGDHYAAEVVEELRAGGDPWRVEGFGGPRLARAGVVLRAGLDDLAVIGVVEGLRRLRWFRRLRHSIVAGWRRDPPDAVLFVDFPGFNLRLARAARGLGLRTLYYVTPAVWAWLERRVETLRAVDELLVIYPFEERFFAERGLRARFVGHPLGREVQRPRDRTAFLREVGLDSAADLLALLPGSRRQELRELARLFAEAGRSVQAASARPLQLAFGVATAPLADELATLVGRAIPIVVGRTPDLLAAAGAAITKSGSVTVEAALLGTPIVVAYRLNPLTLWLARRLVRTDYITMVNILRGRPVVSELLQSAATPEALAAHALELLDPDSPRRRAMRNEFDGLRRELVGRDAPREVAAVVRAVVGAQGRR